MSRFKVHAVYDGTTRSIELDRKNFHFSDLKSRVAQKFGTNTFSLRYSSSRGNSIDIQDDSSLQLAVKDALQSRSRFLNVTVSGSGGGGYKPAATQQASRPQAQTQSQPTQRSAQPSRQPQATPSSTPPGTVTSFQVSGNPNSSADRVLVKYDQQPDHFMFTANPSQYDTTVAITVPDPRKLQFLCSWSVQEGSTPRGMQAVQTFNMPFDVTPDLLNASGNTVRLSIPGR